MIVGVPMTSRRQRASYQLDVAPCGFRTRPRRLLMLLFSDDNNNIKFRWCFMVLLYGFIRPRQLILYSTLRRRFKYRQKRRPKDVCDKDTASSPCSFSTGVQTAHVCLALVLYYH